MPEQLRVPVTGRGDLTCYAGVAGKDVVLRLDDDARPDFRAEVILTEGHLLQLLEMLREGRGE